MASVKVLGNRYVSLLLGVILLVTSIYLIYSIRLSINELLLNTINYFSPYLLYFVGVILGFERFLYGLTGSKKFSYFFLGNNEYTGIYLYFFFMFSLLMGAYILIYTIELETLFLKIAEIVEGLGFILFSLSLITF